MGVVVEIVAECVRIEVEPRIERIVYIGIGNQSDILWFVRPAFKIRHKQVKMPVLPFVKCQNGILDQKEPAVPLKPELMRGLVYVARI
ncbi:MAG: hypothetical protein EBU06_06410 [Micrococcales bacterium]|nr:hypothetical protein [Micrococcales bacterium]